jgi:hypothetical protein
VRLVCAGGGIHLVESLLAAKGVWGLFVAWQRNCDNPVSANSCQTCLLWRKIRGGYITGPLLSLPCSK